MKLLLSKSQWEFIGQQAGWINKQAVVFQQTSDRVQKGRDLMIKGPQAYLDSLKKRMEAEGQSTDPENPSVSLIVLKNLHRIIEIMQELLGEEWKASPKANEWLQAAEALSKNKLLQNASKRIAIKRQSGWGKSYDSLPSQLAELKHKVAGFVFQLTRKHGWTLAEINEFLQGNGYLNTVLNTNALDANQAASVLEGLEMVYKDMERLDKDFGAERENVFA